MKRCLAFNPEDRPSMQEIRVILSEEIKAVEDNIADAGEEE